MSKSIKDVYNHSNIYMYSIAQENGYRGIHRLTKKRKCTIYDPRVCSHSRLLEHLGLARKQW